MNHQFPSEIYEFVSMKRKAAWEVIGDNYNVGHHPILYHPRSFFCFPPRMHCVWEVSHADYLMLSNNESCANYFPPSSFQSGHMWIEQFPPRHQNTSRKNSKNLRNFGQFMMVVYWLVKRNLSFINFREVTSTICMGWQLFEGGVPLISPWGEVSIKLGWF